MKPHNGGGVANPQNIAQNINPNQNNAGNQAQNNVFQAPNNAGNQAQNNAGNHLNPFKDGYFKPNKRSDVEFLMAFKNVFMDEESRKKNLNNLDDIDEDKLYFTQQNH